ncbi:MAG: IS200/IS605 family transposase [Bacteroidetes bacterium]|nr:IS200/IS605 family transposase [Bacteroidota bacterium]
MANTYSQIYIHLVFAVKGRENVIDKSFKNELYKYICGIVTNKKQKVFSINGVADHIHILVSIGPDYSISNLVKDIKVNSTKWINEKKFVIGKFQWQEGFGAFSVSQSQISKVATYIDNQEEHHKKTTFKQEYIDFLKSYNIEYDEKYIFNWED